MVELFHKPPVHPSNYNTGCQIGHGSKFRLPLKPWAFKHFFLHFSSCIYWTMSTYLTLEVFFHLVYELHISPCSSKINIDTHKAKNQLTLGLQSHMCSLVLMHSSKSNSTFLNTLMEYRKENQILCVSLSCRIYFLSASISPQICLPLCLLFCC